MAAGRSAPRDTDLQERLLGIAIEAPTRRGDLVFWKGHVAILLDASTIIHASGHHMTVVAEPLKVALARIEPKAGPPTSYRRVEA
jgi:cell wall-associated NlpC family hydrolase